MALHSANADGPAGTWNGTIDSDNNPNGGTLTNWILRADGTTEGSWTMDVGGGGTSWTSMSVGEGWLPPYTRCRVCSTAIWTIPTSIGIGKCTGLLWDYGGGTTPAIITNAEVDRSMPE